MIKLISCKCFRYLNRGIGNPCETNDRTKRKCGWVQESYHVLEPQKKYVFCRTGMFDLQQVNGFKFSEIFIKFRNFARYKLKTT